jgi:sec-independent protein translocase protein TatC
LALIASIFLSMPYLLFQLWGFIAPALYQHEKKLAAPMLIASTALFYTGGAFVFYIVFPLVFKFMAGTTPDGVEIGTDIQLYLDFVIGMFFAFGLAFQVPVVTVLLLIIRMVSPEQMRHARPYVIVGAFTIAAFITPPDVISQTLLAVPMWLMYEAGLWFGERMVNARNAEAQTPTDPTPTTPTPSTTPALTTSSTPDLLPNLPASALYEAPTSAPITHNIEPPKDGIIDNALDTDEDFERAFAQMDATRQTLQDVPSTQAPTPVVKPV